ncbi:hypothetical protein AAF712_010292 [Marasmius tenuissimus]|uniref:Uncharacterized protein n=1 Tax=Marasmius tenuissimus TaxID=585030 RepID=A0ABR2ZME4_9AGAR
MSGCWAYGSSAPLRWMEKQRRLNLMRSENLRRVVEERQSRMEKRRQGRIRSAKYYAQHKADIAARRKVNRDRLKIRLNSLLESEREQIVESKHAKQRKYARRSREKRKKKESDKLTR